MDQRSDDIRQDIEQTRAALDDKLDSLETRAREAFDLRHQVAQRPWMMLGAAVAAGYVLGSMGSDEERSSYGYNAPASYGAQTSPQASASFPSRRDEGLLSQFDDEIEMLKAAAVSTLATFLRDSIREYIPAIGQQLDQTARERGYPSGPRPSSSGGTPTSSPYGSLSEAGNYGAGSPSGVSAPSAEREPGYVKTYQPSGESTRERALGNEPTRS